MTLLCICDSDVFDFDLILIYFFRFSHRAGETGRAEVGTCHYVAMCVTALNSLVFEHLLCEWFQHYVYMFH